MPSRYFLLTTATGLCLILPTVPAYAHLGHIGELAGHSHWIGLGAVGVAGAIAAAAALLPKKKRGEPEDQEAEEVSDGDTEEASA